MELDFDNIEQLYKRILPALKAKTSQLNRIGYPYIKEQDIWEYLATNTWSKVEGLTLADMVNDIFQLDKDNIAIDIKQKKSRIGRRSYPRQNI